MILIVLSPLQASPPLPTTLCLIRRSSVSSLHLWSVPPVGETHALGCLRTFAVLVLGFFFSHYSIHFSLQFKSGEDCFPKTLSRPPPLLEITASFPFAEPDFCLCGRVDFLFLFVPRFRSPREFSLFLSLLVLIAEIKRF